MSTMLKTAAMGLLSRTLQSFLHKYLLEVDVEGVAMPSLMDVDGHSGWGVRLCNVKLREGVELMTLPGKRKVKKKRRKPKKTEQKGSPNEKSSKADTEKRHMNGHAPRRSAEKERGAQQKPSEAENGDDSELVMLMTEQDLVSTPSRSRMMTEEDTDMESALSSRVPSPSFVCRTSVAAAVTGCLSRTTSNTVEATTDDEEEVEIPSAPPSRGAPTIPRGSLVEHDVVFDTQALEGRNGVGPKELFTPINSAEKNEKKIAVETVEEDDEQLNDEHEDDDVEEEFYHTEEDMVLCLGKGGRIGTLDVRLIGKELHVMVEDAFLTVEVCPKPEKDDDTTASTADSTKDDGAKAKKKDKKKPAKSSSKKEAETAGERVIENSLLAQAISAIPHLLLRDVRVQLIMRNKAQESEGEVQTEISPEDSVVELGIEMLSVASGEDFLENFNNDSDSKMAADDMDASTTSYTSRQRVSLQVLEERDENEYLMKRIRTGKGPEGGISVKIYPPRRKRKKIASRVEEKPDWAIQSFANRAQFCIFRCSGLDIRTRIYLGKQKEVALRNNDYAWYGDEYDEYTIDSMLYGVDYIAPAPPPLPPLKKDESFGVEKMFKPEVERFVADENGIQSNKVRSCFHKVARGLTPILCQKDHLPNENCPYCWENGARPNSYSEHPLDSRTPLPGIVFHVELSEPMEVNVDRPALDVIGSMFEFFAIHLDEPAVTDSEETEEDTKPEKTSITQKLKNMAFRKKKEKKETLRAAFPSYMKPETIEVVGVYVSKIIFRVHVMRNEYIYDQGLAFRYWEATLRCTTVDLQMHKSKEKDFQDIRCDLGYFEANDFFGVDQKRLISLGLLPLADLPDGDDSDSISVSSSLSGKIPGKKSKERACWPSTAAVLLQIPKLAENSDFESREGHGLQLRFFSLGGGDSDIPTTTLNARIGVVNIDLPDTLPIDIETMIDQTMSSIFGSNYAATESKSNITTPATGEIKKNVDKIPGMPALIKYAVRLDGGHFRWSPLVHVRLPVMKLGGELSNDGEVFLETILNQVKVQCGKRSLLGKPQSELSLTSMAQLPEDVRMRILFFLKDLGPLEKALGINRESSSFLRCRAVNKGIVKVAKRSITKVVKRKKPSKLPSEPRPSRQEILNELTKLDEQALGDIWMSHKNRSRPPRLNRTRSDSDK